MFTIKSILSYYPCDLSLWHKPKDSFTKLHFKRKHSALPYNRNSINTRETNTYTYCMLSVYLGFGGENLEL